MNLDTLERRILELHNAMSLRTTLDAAVRLGDLLIDARALDPPEGWYNWLARLGIHRRIAAIYMQVARAAEDDRLKRISHDGLPLSLTGFLRRIRQARRASYLHDRDEARQDAIRTAAPADKRYRVVRADCKKYRWPAVDLVACDPPWQDPEAYRWLGRFAMSHLREGGAALVQVGNREMAESLAALTEAGLTYRWTLAIVYKRCLGISWALPFQTSWRPVLVLSNGLWDRKGLRTCSDAYTVDGLMAEKQCHVWQQPLRPWVAWLEAMTRPGDMVGDPFTGSGTIPLACKLVGGRSCIATDLDRASVATARQRIAEAVEGSGLPDSSGG